MIGDNRPEQLYSVFRSAAASLKKSLFPFDRGESRLGLSISKQIQSKQAVERVDSL